MLRLSFGILLLGVIVYGQTTVKPSSTHAVTKRQTTPKPKPAPPLKCKFFDIAIKRPKLWNDKYANPATKEHMERRWELESALHQLFDKENEFNAFNLINMKKDKDDMAVHFYLIFNKEGTYLKPLEDAVAAGKIGTVVVDKKFIKKECYKEPKPVPAYCNAPCSTMCAPACTPSCCGAYNFLPQAPPPPPFACPPACTALPTCGPACPPACCRSKVKN